MASTHKHLNDGVEMLIGELMMEEELGDWAPPMSKRELNALLSPSYRFWEEVVDELDARLADAA